MMQPVAELMEQCGHFIVREERRFAFQRTVKVTGQVRDRFLQRAVGFAHLADAIIHPRAAALVLAGIQVEVEAAAQFAGFIEQIEETHVRMVHIHIFALFGGDTVNAFYHFEEAVYRALFRSTGVTARR